MMVVYNKIYLDTKGEKMKRALNLIEITLIICFIAAISAISFTLYNQHGFKATQRLNPSGQGFDLNAMSPQKASETISYNVPPDTVDSKTLSVLASTSDTFTIGLSRITYADLKNAVVSSNNNGLFDLANTLIKRMKLNYPQFTIINVTPDTLANLVRVLNAAVEVPDSSPNKQVAQAYITKFKMLINK